MHIYRYFVKTQCGPHLAGNIKKIEMILEVAILDVLPEKTADFEASFELSAKIISSMKGWLGHQLQQCLEVPNRYILLVKWETLEDHTIGFRQSPEYQTWRKNLHHYYSPFPIVEHYFLKYEAALPG